MTRQLCIDAPDSFGRDFMMTSLNQFLNEELSWLAAKDQLRSLPKASINGAVQDACVIDYQGKSLINFSSNDYFGLSVHPEVISAGVEGLKSHGAGGRASRIVAGNYAAYHELEQALATMKRTEAALVFSSGYAGNIGTITALMREGDVIIADKLAHACLLDGAKQSGATLMRFAHNNIQHLEQLLEIHRAEYKNCLVITESIFSMDGDITPISDIAALAQTFGAWLMVDDAHGLGLTEQLLKPLVGLDGVVISGTLSKAAGNLGGYVAGSKALIDYLMNHSRSFVFSTALPPAVVHGAIKALEIISREPERTQKPLALAKHFTRLMGLAEAQSPIVPVILGENEKALKASAALLEQGFYVRAIRPPTVPPNTARLRITFTALHTETQVEQLAGSLRILLGCESSQS